MDGFQRYFRHIRTLIMKGCMQRKSRLENPQKPTQLSLRSHPKHLVGKRTAQKDAIKDTTSDSQVNSYFQYRLPPASYAQPQKVAGYYVIPSELLSVCPSVCPSVRPSRVDHLCLLYNFNSVQDNFTKLGTI